jgi:peptidoglycan/xylan/chitin deacetylase (PgdA/CDA1 family)
MTAARARALHANEMGEILVLMYHLIGEKEGRYNRSAQQFRQDIADLKAKGYYPINVRDLASGNINVPAGKAPVVITFDDSSPGQYRILANGTVDPDCAVGILLAAAKNGGWARRASFFPLIDVIPAERDIFGQPDLKQKKLQNLVAWGFEVGSHTVSHLNLQKASAEQAEKQLAESQSILEQMIGRGYKVTSLAIPQDYYPTNPNVLPSGDYKGQHYEYTAILKATGGPSPSPFSTTFDRLHIHRIEIGGDQLKERLAYFDSHPELRFVSDGDPTTISAPRDLPASLGAMRSSPAATVIRY